MKENMSTKFWREYNELDIIQRQEKCEMFAGYIIRLCKEEKFKKEYLELCASTYLMGLFDDLINYMERKNNDKH